MQESTGKLHIHSISTDEVDRVAFDFRVRPVSASSLSPKPYSRSALSCSLSVASLMLHESGQGKELNEGVHP